MTELLKFFLRPPYRLFKRLIRKKPIKEKLSEIENELKALKESGNYRRAISVAKQMKQLEWAPIVSCEHLAELYLLDGDAQLSRLAALEGFAYEQSNDVLAERIHGHKVPFSLKQINDLKQLSFYSNGLLEEIEQVDPEDKKAARKMIKEIAPWYQPIIFDGNLKSECSYSFASDWVGVKKWEGSIAPLIPFSLENKIVWDVGCSSGLFTALMAQQGTSTAVGIETLGRGYLQSQLTKKLLGAAHGLTYNNLEFHCARASDMDLGHKGIVDLLVALNVIYWINFSSPLFRSRPDGDFLVHKFMRNISENVRWLLIQGDENVFKLRQRKNKSCTGTGSKEIHKLFNRYGFSCTEECHDIRYSAIAKNKRNFSDISSQNKSISVTECVDYWGNPIEGGPHFKFAKKLLSGEGIQFEETDLFDHFNTKAPFLKDYIQNESNFLPTKKNEILMKMTQYAFLLLKDDFCDEKYDPLRAVKRSGTCQWVVEDGCFRAACQLIKGNLKIRANVR